MKYNKSMQNEIDKYLDLLVKFEDKIVNNRLIEVSFHEAIQENAIFENIKAKFEHDILVTVLKMNEEGLSNAEINEKLKPLLKEMDVKLKELYLKSKHFKEIYLNIEELGRENIPGFKQHYYDFIKDKYIMLKRPVSDELVKDYDDIRNCFLSFDQKMVDLINNYKYTCNLEEDERDDFDEFIAKKSEALLKEMENIKKYDENFSQLEEDLKDDMTIADRESKIRDENYKITKENEELQQRVESFAKGEIDYEWFDKSKES